MLVALGLLIGLVVGGVLGAVAIRTVGASRFDKALRTRQELLQDAQREAEAMRREARVEAREEAVKLRAGIEAENQERRAQLARIEERVEAKQQEVEAALEEIRRREQGLADREEASKGLHTQLKETKQRQLAELERLAGMTVAEAKQHLLERSEDLVRRRPAPRDGPPYAHEADRGRAHSPGAHRGDVLPVEGGARGLRAAGRRA